MILSAIISIFSELFTRISNFAPVSLRKDFVRISFLGCQYILWCYTDIFYSGEYMNQQVFGVLFAVAAFTAWGFLPAYWKQMQDYSAQ